MKLKIRFFMAAVCSLVLQSAAAQPTNAVNAEAQTEKLLLSTDD